MGFARKLSLLRETAIRDSSCIIQADGDFDLPEILDPPQYGFFQITSRGIGTVRFWQIESSNNVATFV